MLRNLTNSPLSNCSRSIFPDPRPVGLHRVGGVICNLRFELKLLIFSHQSNLHLHYNIFVNPSSTYTYYKIISPLYYFINPSLLKQELFSAINKSDKGFQHKTPPT